MKKLLISLGAVALAMNASATSALDQAKLNTVKKIYQYQKGELYPRGELYKYSTPDFKKLMDKKAMEYDSTVENQEICLISGSSGGSIASPPTFKVVNGKVNVTFLQLDHLKHSRSRVTLKYDLKCKNGICLVSDIIDKNGKSLTKTILDKCLDYDD